jgi:50S ribosomal subunit-associated GTPase HflX
MLLGDRKHESVHLSAVTGEGLFRLDEIIRRRLDARSVVVDVTIPMSRGDVLATVRRHGVVLDEDVLEDVAIRVRTRFLERVFGNLRRRTPSEVRFDIVAPAEEPYMVGESAEDAPWDD